MGVAGTSCHLLPSHSLHPENTSLFLPPRPQYAITLPLEGKDDGNVEPKQLVRIASRCANITDGGDCSNGSRLARRNRIYMSRASLRSGVTSSNQIRPNRPASLSRPGPEERESKWITSHKSYPTRSLHCSCNFRRCFNRKKSDMSISAMFGTRVPLAPSPPPASPSSKAAPRFAGGASIGGGGMVATVECSSRPKKKATAHHMKTRPRKTQAWDIRRKPTVYAPLPPLPSDWTLVSSGGGGGGDDADAASGTASSSSGFSSPVEAPPTS